MDALFSLANWLSLERNMVEKPTLDHGLVWSKAVFGPWSGEVDSRLFAAFFFDIEFLWTSRPWSSRPWKSQFRTMVFQTMEKPLPDHGYL